ncbi:hypothetical protein AAMO2058_000559000 [Amorphochlora amoebiformis]
MFSSGVSLPPELKAEPLPAKSTSEPKRHPGLIRIIISSKSMVSGGLERQSGINSGEILTSRRHLDENHRISRTKDGHRLPGTPWRTPSKHTRKRQMVEGTGGAERVLHCRLFMPENKI